MSEHSISADLRSRLREMGLQPKKALGQNFLVSPTVIARILAAVKDCNFTDLIEIGPGLGALTEPLLELGLKPRLIELDPELVAYWRGRRLTVVDHDALKVDWEGLALAEPALLVSNLPYQISTNLVVDRCFGPRSLRYMVLMFQKEVAQRLTAAPRSKEYGLLSVMAQLHFRMHKVTEASPRDFYPPPKVASRVLRFERLPVVGLGPPFLKFLKAAFAFRRKFLLKNLNIVLDKPRQLRLLPLLEELGHSGKVRAEELSPLEFERLFKGLYGRE